MEQFSKIGITQVAMSIMSGSTRSSISRFITSNGISPLSEGQKKNIRYGLEDVRNALKELYTHQYAPEKKVLAFYNFKGGTGKTSLCYQVSTHLALLGFKVLVIDADPQAHLTTSLQIESENSEVTLHDIINGTVSVEDAIKNIYPGLDCIPSNLSLTRLETLLNGMPKREERVKIALQDYTQKYDYIIFDTNPTISHLNRNIMTFASLLNIVCETQPYSLNGLKLLMEDNNSFYSNMQLSLPQYLIIPNKYEDRMSSSAEAMTALRQFYSQYLIPDFAIRKSEDINTSAKNQLPLAFFAKSNSNAFSDVMELIHCLVKATCQSTKNGRQMTLQSVKAA